MSEKITENISKKVSVFSNNCMGCKRHEKDLMITSIDKNDDIVDLFITEEQARGLIVDLENGLVEVIENKFDKDNAKQIIDYVRSQGK